MNPRDAALINDAVRFVLANARDPTKRTISFVSHRERDLRSSTMLIEFSKISAQSFRLVHSDEFRFRVVCLLVEV